MFNIQKIPFLRLLVPYILGIAACFILDLNNLSTFCLISVITISYVLFNLGFKFFNKRNVFVLISDLLLFALGILYTYNTQLKNDTSFFKNHIENDTVFYLAELSDLPVQKQRSVKLNLNVLQVKNDSAYIPVKGTVIGYLQNSSVVKDLKVGQIFLIKSTFQEVRGPMNPNEFNFKNYLSNKNIYHTTFIDSNSITLLHLNTGFSLVNFGLGFKERIVDRLKESGLSRDAYSICAALITGFDDEVDKKVVEEFSHSGTLHVLSVSGLHVGLIYLLLNFLFIQFDRSNKYKLIHFILVTICLWFFALITGFSAPVLRAVIMFNLLGIGKLFFRNKPDNQLNILFVSAFILLLINPLLIRDVGFLLSYSAMFGILYFYPKWVNLLKVESKIGNYIWQSSIISFSATLCTLPITLFVFHQFPIWFTLANLIVVPISFVLLILSFISLLKLSWVTLLVNKLTALLLVFIKLFNTEGLAFIDHIDFSTLDSILLGLLIYMASIAVLKRKFMYVQLTFLVLILWQLYGLFNSFQAKQKNELVIYHIPKASSKSIKLGNNVWIDHMDTAKYSMNVKPTITAYNYPNKHNVNFNYVRMQHVQLLTLSEKNKLPLNKHLKVSHVLVSNNAVPTDEFFNSYRFSVLIADGSNNRYSCKVLRNKCEKFGVDFYSTDQQGAFILPLTLK